MKRIVKTASLAALGSVLLYGAACAALWAMQRSLLYFPQPSVIPLGDAKGRIDWLDVPQTEEAPAARLQLSVRPLPGPKALVYFGGNADDVARYLPDLTRAFPNRALYLLHYRGFGHSSGVPTEAALHADALALFDQAHAQHADVMVVGRSLGSGLAVRVAAERPVSRLVLVTPYNSVMEVAQQLFPWAPVPLLIRDRYESWRFAPRIQVPTTFVVADHDHTVPRASTDALFAHFAPGIASYHLLPGSTHADIVTHPDYLATLHAADAP